MMARGGWLRWGWASATLASAFVFGACGAFEDSPPRPTPTPTLANLLRDGSFEGEAPAWRPYGEGVAELALDRGRTGSQSAHLLTGDAAIRSGFTQSVPGGGEFPEFVSGYYFIDEGNAEGYLQFSVNALGGGPDPVRKLTFLIAGAATEPEFERYVFLSRDAPVTGEWTYFAYPLRQAFLDEAFAVPAQWDSIDLTFELQATGEGEAVAYFDDLYMGPQLGNPNRPKEARE